MSDMASVPRNDLAGSIRMSDLLQSAYELKQAAEQRAEDSRQALAKVVIEICPGKLDRDRRFLEKASATELAEMIISEIADQRDELNWHLARSLGNGQSAAVPAQSPGGKPAQALTVIGKVEATLREEIEKSKVALRNYETQVQQLTTERGHWQAEKAQLQSALNAFQLAPATLTPAEIDVVPELESPAVGRELWPDWLRELEPTRGFNNLLRFVKAAGSTWECRRQRLVSMLNKPGADSGHLRSLPKLMAESERPLIVLHGVADDEDNETDEAGEARPAGGAEVGAARKLGQMGRPGNLVELTEDGRSAYQQIFGTPPLRAYEQYLARHKSDQQIALVLEAIDLLEWAGHTVERFPAVVNLPGDHRFAPDLVARKAGREIAIEVEVGSAYYNPGDREQKWQNVAAATGRQIYVVTPNREIMQAIQTELMSWQVGKSETRVHLTCISEIRARQRAGTLKADDIWLRNR
jgi:hypothetical protein